MRGLHVSTHCVREAVHLPTCPGLCTMARAARSALASPTQPWQHVPLLLLCAYPNPNLLL